MLTITKADSITASSLSVCVCMCLAINLTQGRTSSARLLKLYTLTGSLTSSKSFQSSTFLFGARSPPRNNAFNTHFIIDYFTKGKHLMEFLTI